MADQPIPKGESKKILRQYLGRFYVKLTVEDWERLEKHFPCLKTVYIRNNGPALRRFGAFFLLAFGKKNYRFYYTHELVDAYVGNKSLNDEEDSQGVFYDAESPLVILYHMANTMENKQLENMVSHMVTQRHMEGKVTLVLTEIPLAKVETCFKSNELMIWNSNVKSSTEEI